MLADKAILRVPRVVAPAERADQRWLSDDERIGEPAIVADDVALVYREGETNVVELYLHRAQSAAFLLDGQLDEMLPHHYHAVVELRVRLDRGRVIDLQHLPLERCVEQIPVPAEGEERPDRQDYPDKHGVHLAETFDEVPVHDGDFKQRHAGGDGEGYKTGFREFTVQIFADVRVFFRKLWSHEIIPFRYHITRSDDCNIIIPSNERVVKI